MEGGLLVDFIFDDGRLDLISAGGGGGVTYLDLWGGDGLTYFNLGNGIKKKFHPVTPTISFWNSPLTDFCWEYVSTSKFSEC